ncbi:MAG: HD-GYP domain-containing protein [Thermodesulforhabdaceae bacterium]
MIFRRDKKLVRRRVNPGQLKKGMLVEIPLPWFRHPFWRSRFVIKEDSQIEKIKALDIPFVFVLSSEAHKKNDLKVFNEKDMHTKEVHLPEIPSPSSPSHSHHFVEDQDQEKISSAKLYLIKYQKCEKAYEQTISQVKTLLNGLLFFSEESLKDAQNMMRKMVDTLINDPSTMLFLINAKKKQEEVFHHALNTCILSLLLARAENLPPEDIFTIGLGALFHDIGKLKIPKTLILKTQPLTKSEKSFLQLHPQFGLEIVSKISSFPEEPKQIIGEHHETLDGKGYPKGLRGDKIGIATRIVSIVNIYDNLCNPPVLEKAMTPYHALAFMYKKLNEKLDKRLMELFIRILGVYPPGTIVKLSSGSVGIVVSKSPNQPHKPLVMLYNPDVPPSKAPVISLEEEPSLDIEQTIHPSSLPQEVFVYLNPPLRIAYMADSFAKD